MRAIFCRMTWDMTYETSLMLTRLSDIHFDVDTRGDKTILSTYFLFWFEEDHWLVTRQLIGFVAQFSKQSSVYVRDTFQPVQGTYVAFVLLISMLTSNNNMRTRHVQLLKFVIITPLFIQPSRKISSGSNLSRVYLLLDQKSCVVSIKLKNNVCLPF